MENLVVISFQNLQHASEAMDKLKELDDIGEIVIYNQVLVRKDPGNLFTMLDREGPDTIDLPGEGALIGSLFRLVGGPIGLGIGLLTGLLAGTADENNTEIFYPKILRKVKVHVTEGRYALLLDVEEISTFMIDSYMPVFSEKIFRTNIEDVYNEFDRRQREKLDGAIKETERELKKALQKDKAAIKEKINQLKAERRERREWVNRRNENASKQLLDKIDNIRNKLSSARQSRKSWLHSYKIKLEGKRRQLNREMAGALFRVLY